MKPTLLRLFCLFLGIVPRLSASQLPGIDFEDLAHAGADPETVTYKSTAEGDLTLDLYRPEAPGPRLPALVFVHGGGWTAGTHKNHHEHSRYFAARGMVVFNLSYRLIPNSGDGIKLFEQIGDIRSAVRWIRAHAATYGIDPDRIALAGESAGGHLAACVAFIDAFDASGEDLTIAAKPNLAILLNPITDLPRISWYANHAARVGEQPLPVEDTPIANPLDESIHPARRLSPLFYAHKADQPPALFVHGEADTVVPFAQSETLHKALVEAGHHSKLLALPRTDHAFVIPGWGPPEAINRTLRAMDAFLLEHGFLSGSAPLLPLDINLLENGHFETDLRGWVSRGFIQVSAPGAEARSRGFLRGEEESIRSLSQTLSLDALALPAKALSRQLLTAKLSADLRVSELSHYATFELALQFFASNGTLIETAPLAWFERSPHTWSHATLEVLIPPDTATIEIAANAPAASPIELDEISLTLSSTTRTKTYAAWQALYFTDEEIAAQTVAAPEAIFSIGSALTNLERYAFGMSRRDPDRPSYHARSSGDHLLICFPYDAKKTDLTYGARFSSDLNFDASTTVQVSSETPFRTGIDNLGEALDPEPGPRRFAQAFIMPK